MRIVIDTNVLVSAAIKPRGETGRIVTHLRNGRFTLLYASAVLEELVDVLNRPRLVSNTNYLPIICASFYKSSACVVRRWSQSIR